MVSNQLPHTDPLLLQRIAEEDEAAFRQLFHDWKDKLYGFIFSLTRSEQQSEDIVQEVFTKVWLNRNKLNEVTNFSAWLFRIAQNHAIDQLRKISRESVFLASLHRKQTGSSDPEEQLLTKETNQLLQQALDSLPSRQREIYLLHQEQGLKHQEIAIKLGLSVSTVQNHMFRALENIRNYLAAHFPDAAIGLVMLLMAKRIIE